MTMTTNPSSPPNAPVGVEGMIKLLERIRDLLTSLPVDCLGSGTGANGQPYPIRDEVIHGITTALAQQPAAGAVDKVRFRKAPCYLCGYNGPGYYQPDTHPCAAKYHATQHQEPTT